MQLKSVQNYDFSACAMPNGPELANAAKVSVDTVARFERGDELKERTVEAIRFALEAGGIEFIEGNGGGPGVRIRKRQVRKRS